MSRRRQREKAEKANAEDDASRYTGQIPNENLPAKTFEEYQCSGNVEIDFPGLCALLDIKDIPAVSTKQPASTTETEAEDPEDRQSRTNSAPFWSKPCLQVMLETEDPLSAKKLNVSGCKVDEQTARVLQKMLLSLCKLQSLQFWQAGLTDPIAISLMNTISQCSNLRAVTLEGNHLPEQSYHLLLSENSILTHLSLRNNRMGDNGARLIGLALSTTKSANRSLLSLNLAFNSIGDAGTTHIAQGLRLNRALLFLSLANNQIGDTGAAHLATVLGEFALTHEEVVARRKMLLTRAPSETSKKDDKSAENKENPKSNKTSSDMKVSQNKGGKQAGKEKQPSKQEDKSSISLNELHQQGESVEIVSPLLDQAVQYRDSGLVLPGNRTLTSLNLAGNRITEKSLHLFLTSLEMQREGGGLLRLCLQRNRFPPECECYVKIKERMTLVDPLERNSCEHTEEEEQGA